LALLAAGSGPGGGEAGRGSAPSEERQLLTAMERRRALAGLNR
jgi:hypothetical protein